MTKRYKVSQSTISAAIKQVRGVLSRVGGAEYEQWKYMQLKAAYPDD